MKIFLPKISLAILLLVSINFAGFSQYEVQSQYINEPELMIEFAEDCALFWQGVHDDTYGGFFVEVGKSGNILNNNNKSLVSESRDAYGFTRAFMLTGNEEYLDYAKSALDFMYEHLWDEQYGGWHRRCNRSGNYPYLGEKTAFDQHYALLGITAYYEATNNATDLEMLENGYDFIENSLWDNRPEYLGYYDETNRSGSFSYDKSFNATVDAITTHLYNLYLITKDDKYFTRLMEMKRNIQDYLVSSMANQEIGFVENYNSTWAVNNSERRTIMGHVLKTGWCMGRIYRINEDDETLESAKALVQNVLDKGYDHELGGPYKDYDRITGEMYMYGASDTAKAWWQMEQAITSGFLLYEITAEDKYLKMADESLDFFMNYFVDPVYGEIYADRNREGGRVPGWDENKGSEWKAAYHSIETAYYSFLYSKLLIKQESATLYYKFDATADSRTLNMTPLAVDFAKLKIDNITLNGNDYPDFNSDLRTLTIPAGTGGIFAVSYKMTSSPYSVEENETLASVNIFPNPFKNVVYLEFNLKKANFVNVSVYNNMGQKIETLENRKMTKGQYNLSWNTEVNPGFYYIVMTADGQRFTYKIIRE